MEVKLWVLRERHPGAGSPLRAFCGGKTQCCPDARAATKVALFAGSQEHPEG